jgi:hypothetical protein
MHHQASTGRVKTHATRSEIFSSAIFIPLRVVTENTMSFSGNVLFQFSTKGTADSTSPTERA